MGKRCRPGWLATGAFAALALTMACKKDEVTYARVPKEAAGGGAPAMPGPRPGGGGGGAPMGGGMAGDVPPPPRPEGGLAWTLPKGWEQSMGGGMRYATLKAPVPGKLDVSVVVLPGPAGGELANVNRWRGQIGLGPMDEAALRSARTAVKSKAGELAVYDFTSDGQVKSRLVAGLAEVEGNTWFVKMVGDAGPVATARPEFIRLLESLRLERKNP
jgi:hypothetical protein